MKKANFETDYMAGAHPKVLSALVETNMLKTVGYGLDHITQQAKNTVLKACGLAEHTGSEVYFLVGGTQANSTVIDGLLRQAQGVIAADTAHINVHESGAIEAGGHKVIALKGENGKISAEQVREYLRQFYGDDTWPHMVQPGMVYISFPTELGTIYSKHELEELRKVCDQYAIPLFIDGARLGYGLASPKADVTLEDIAKLSHVFYIGGTKQGTLMGEAVVIKDKQLMPRFFTLIKMHGGLLAKGRLLGVQFQALLNDHLLMNICSQAVDYALEIKDAMVKAGYKPLIDSWTNQQFFLLPNELVEKLKDEVGFELWGAPGEKETAVRFVTSWATTHDEVDFLTSLL